MKIVLIRRISQSFFLALFLWFCFVTVLGDKWHQLRGWPVNWFLELDPLVAIATVLGSGKLYAGLAWAVLTLCLTFFVGRFFCGWVCPFGTMHQFIGWLAHRKKRHAEKLELNKYRPIQAVKFYLLAFILGAAGLGLVYRVALLPRTHRWLWAVLVLVVVGGLILQRIQKSRPNFVPLKRKHVWWLTVVAATVCVLALVVGPGLWSAGSLWADLLDPIPLVYRSVNLFALAIAGGTESGERYYVGAWLLGLVFVFALGLNAVLPRFYCRFACPLGALFGLLVRWAPWRIGKRLARCNQCGLCQRNCEGACDPAGRFRVSECVLCMNCLHVCPQAQIAYSARRSAAGEFDTPKLSRRGFVLAVGSGLVSVPMLRLSGLTGPNWAWRAIRPPGALPEPEFLQRCIKCGQCMKVCPSNIIQPAWFESGAEGLWTPVLNYRVGTSGCQLTCVACSNVCPTGALRPLSVEEKLGQGRFAARGPVRVGTASVDHGRCLPWAKDTPCIVCQEVCPVTPKAIYVREVYHVVRDGHRRVRAATGSKLVLDGPPLRPGALATGDYYVRVETGPDTRPRLIETNSANEIVVSALDGWTVAPPENTPVAIVIRLQQPYVDPKLCIGCGMCEHECPVSGLRAIRVTAENESRDPRHSLTAGS